MATGITPRQTADCVRRHGKDADCRCARLYSAWVYDAHTQKKVRRSFPTLAAAKSWRASATSGLEIRKREPTSDFPTLREAALQWFDDAEDGKIDSRRRRGFAAHTLRDYRSSLERLILPEFGALRLDEVTADGLQAFVNELRGSGLSGSTINNTVAPLQRIFHEHQRTLPSNPTRDLDLPERKGKTRDAITPREAAELIEALLPEDRPLWSAAFYTGARSGELQALPVENIDTASVSIMHGWDARVGRVGTKSEAGERTIPLPAILADVLREHVKRNGRSGADLVFCRTASAPFFHSWIGTRAKRAWDLADEQRANRKLPPLKRATLHVARHSYSTWLDAAGSARRERIVTSAIPVRVSPSATATCSRLSYRKMRSGSTRTSAAQSKGRSSPSRGRRRARGEER
jgi:integrase